ncbi:MAG: GTPase Era [Pseudomonadota bacterium]
MSEAVQNTKCGYAAVIGAPNAGKSTLINEMVGTKVSIVSPKVQTTRTRVLGIVMQDEAQIVLVDTPGIFEPDKRKTMERAMVAAALDGLSDADVILFLVDAHAYKRQDLSQILERLKAQNRPVALVLNKVDKINPEKLLELSKELNDAHAFEVTFMVSALKGKGVDDITSYLADVMPEGPHLFPEDQVSDMPVRLLAAEITREKLFHKLHQELPYALTVETEEWEPFQDGSIKINQTIYVARDNHKGIVLGKGGSLIKDVGEKSRIELEDILETRVHLKLFVKVRENWMDDPERYAIWGLNTDS